MNIFTMILALLFVIALMLGLAWIIKRVGFNSGGRNLLNPNPSMRILETLPLDSKRRLFLVDIAGKQKVFLLGMGSEQCLDIDVDVSKKGKK